MVHAVSHIGSRFPSLTPPATAAGAANAQPKSAAPSFASSLKSLFGAPAKNHLATPVPATTTVDPVPAPPPDTSLKALFGQPVTLANPDPPAPPQAPTAESVFGANPWVTAPVGQGPKGITYAYNPLYFATPATAQKVAQMVGGTAIQSNEFTPNGGPFQQQEANWMVRLPNGNKINPGILASFYTHGYPQSYIDGLIAGYVNG
jgi:hypothetical protein